MMRRAGLSIIIILIKILIIITIVLILIIIIIPITILILIMIMIAKTCLPPSLDHDKLVQLLLIDPLQTTLSGQQCLHIRISIRK